MNPWIDVPVGWALSQLGGVALTSFSAYAVMMHSPAMRPGVRGWLAGARSRASFYNARRTVPAYRAFLDEHGARNPRSFKDLPVMTKDNYIKR